MERFFELFNYKNLGSVRINLDEQGNPWFCLSDVCDILGLTNNRMVNERIDTPYVSSIDVGVQTGVKKDGSPAMQNVKMTFVNEAGLYQAIGQSRKPEARAFMNWVFSEVLPSIRKNGSYSLPNMSVNEILHSITGTLVEYDKKFDEIDGTIKDMSSRVDGNSNDILAMKTDISDIRRIQEVFIKSGYLSVRGFCILANLKLPVSETAKIGKKATNICKLNNIRMGTEPCDHFGYVNTYPYSVLAEIFDEYVKN